MKYVRIRNNKVSEVIPENAVPIPKWYNQSFAEECVEAPDEVDQNWYYNPDTGEFRAPEYGPFNKNKDSVEVLLDAIII